MAGDNKENAASKIGGFFTGVKGEFQKISWPNRARKWVVLHMVEPGRNS